MSASSTLTQGGLDLLTRPEEATPDHDEVDYSGWFCIATDPWPCPGRGCDFVAHHLTAAHLIVVWPEKDDSNLLHHANLAKRYGRNPRVVEYEVGFGRAISFYEYEAEGRPVHGVNENAR